ncbi:MAG TPA: ABC transporter permease [Terracidiphilus sp.]|jgi:ABC-2 type transport system permease protein
MSTASLTLRRSGLLGRSVRVFFREGRYEFLRLLRTRSFALSVIGFPVVFYLFFGIMLNRGQNIGTVSVAKYMLGSYAVFGMVGAALFGIGIGLSSELAAGWLDLKRASPMPPLAYVLAKCSSAMAFGILIVTTLVIIGITLGNVSLSLVEYARMMALTLVGVIPFACMGMALALLVPFASAPGIANIIYLPMSFCGGLWLPIMLLPHPLQKMAVILPTYHLAQLMLSILGFAGAGATISHWYGLLGFTLLMLGIAALALRRIEQNS